MLVVRNRNELMNRFKVLIGNNKDLVLYHNLGGANNVTMTKFKGHMKLANAYRNLVRLIERAKDKKSADDFATFIDSLRHDAVERVELAAGELLEKVAIESLAISKEGIEYGFRKVYGQDAVVVVPDSYWKKTAQSSIEAMKRFSADTNRILDTSLDDEKWDDMRDSVEKKTTSRIADEAFIIQSEANRLVQEYAGVRKYKWKTQGDRRVVGNPSGLYPVGNDEHGDHWSRDGKIFEWDNPPHDGHPGEAFGCRCVALPMMNLNNAEIR